MTEITEQSTSKSVDIDGLKIHYNDAGAGPIILFLHGSGPGATGWSNFGANIKELSKEFRTIAIDFPGWGQSGLEIPEDGKLVTAVRLFMDALGIDKAALVGNSMGGVVATAFTAEFGDRVSHLVTMGAPFINMTVYSNGIMTSEGMRVLIKGYQEPTPENFKRLVEVMCFDAKFATDELAQERSDAALAHPEQLKAFLEGRMMRVMPNNAANLHKIAKIQAPTLAFHGRNDLTVHFEHSMQLVSVIENARMILLNQCGHWAQLEHADEFNRTVGSFVRDAG
ncbi:MAG: alpha/beta fold hydrolase [Parvibaculaceae bacterium]|nr:alpha/beta fold hydrolase [Parvibaculaceae bacterium]